jgi:hypothetical protein
VMLFLDDMGFLQFLSARRGERVLETTAAPSASRDSRYVTAPEQDAGAAV